MSYVKTNWIDGTTPVSALNMNNIENGIAKSSLGIEVNIIEFGGSDDGVVDNLAPFLAAKTVCGIGGTILFPRTNGITNSVYYFSAFPVANTGGVTFDVAENVKFSLPASPDYGQDLSLTRDIQVFCRLFNTNLIWYKDLIKKHYISESDIDKSVITSVPSTAIAARTCTHNTAYAVTGPAFTPISTSEVSIANSGLVIGCGGIVLQIGECLTASFSNPGTIPFKGGILVLTALSHAYLYMKDISGVQTTYISYMKADGVFHEYNSWNLGAYASYASQNALWSVERVTDSAFRVLCNGINISNGVIDLGESIIFCGFGAYNDTFHIKNMIKETNKVKGGIEPLAFSIYGDSLTENKHGSWEQIFKKALDGSMGVQAGIVNNNAIGGYTSAMTLTKMQSVGLAGANYLLLLIGTNDIQQQTPVATYIANVNAMVTIAKTAKARVILAVPPLFYPITMTGYGQASSNYEKGSEYRSALLRYAGDNDIKIIDLPNILGVCTTSNDIVIDDIHPSFKSSEIIGIAFAKAVLGDYLAKHNAI